MAIEEKVTITTKDSGSQLRQRLSFDQQRNVKFIETGEPLPDNRDYFLLGSISSQNLARICIRANELPNPERYHREKEYAVLDGILFKASEADPIFRTNDITDALSVNNRLLMADSSDLQMRSETCIVDGQQRFKLSYTGDLGQYKSLSKPKLFKKHIVKDRTVFVQDDNGNYELKARTREDGDIDYILQGLSGPWEVYFTPGTAFTALTHPVENVQIGDRTFAHGSLSIPTLYSKFTQIVERVNGKGDPNAKKR
ncbi:TPA: hypothetical protein HA246_00400 [Candidatus Woesearchaeota archaeon]|nr:hypothetical protein [Candidatus Woesearchaeota archaeon]